MSILPTPNLMPSQTGRAMHGRSQSGVTLGNEFPILSNEVHGFSHSKLLKPTTCPPSISDRCLVASLVLPQLRDWPTDYSTQVVQRGSSPLTPPSPLLFRGLFDPSISTSTLATLNRPPILPRDPLPIHLGYCRLLPVGFSSGYHRQADTWDL
ncbi:hypothetical protein P691DRAFT_808592 [Macrolepiota fuliginosa MF-IS2]|uniref:Uncharacterized protein n=1 Tax=Macrolepiota fuliginosa MF-IS2 TaxID=1400762 RepID=A0A9P6CAV0_9AGAR|nr:hypothetical protein P691DRAFT_808592 [Macrolepiota fuliginosa MF-IS2]